MKKLFIPLLITMTGLAVNSALAQSTATITKPNKNSGFVTVTTDNGEITGKELDATTRNKYLTDICSATGSGESYTISDKQPKIGSEESGVYLVEVNDYWIGMQGTWSVYDQLNKGVSKISAVKSDSKQETSTGTFYTHPAENVNKFFFIKLRSKIRRTDTPFGWYDEWSYVTDPEVNGSAGWDALEPTWDTLMDGTPFPSPHNCNSSLENNHYIALDGEIPTDRLGHDFTAYLYIPEKCEGGTEPSVTYETIGYGNISSTPKTYYIYNKGGWGRKPTSELTYVFTDPSGSVSFAKAYEGKFYTTNWEYGSTKVQGYEYENTKKVVKEGECPYVFFYAVDLQDVPEKHVTKKTGELAEGESKYQVELHWNTAFDKFANHGVQKYAEYDGNGDASKGMQEHYVIQRSYDYKTWETVDDKLIVSGNDVKDAANKTIIDKGLKEKDSEFGFTVWYCVTSYVEKSNGTRMSKTTSNVVRVEIPGTVPFKLTLAGEGTSKYDPVSVKNTFTNTIISSYSKVEKEPEVKAGSTLSLFRVDPNDKTNTGGFPNGENLITVTAENGNTTLADLAKQIKNNNNPEGKYTDTAILDAGEGNEAAYRLVMKIPGENGNPDTYVYSNILRISNPAIANASIAAHRSGYPDAETCQNGNPEIFHNEITFKASANRVGTGYYIYRDKKADPIMTLIYNGEDGFRVVNSADNTSYKSYTGGVITIIDIVSADPIAEGEGRNPVSTAGWSYAVAYSDNVGNEKENTYGSTAERAEYKGLRDELVLSVEANIQAANFKQPGNYDIYTIFTINWSRRLAIADTEPERFEIYLKKNGKDPVYVKTEEESATASIDLATDGASFEKIYEVEATPKNENGGSYTFDKTYTSANQKANGKYSTEKLAEILAGEYEVYVKMITTEGKEKNSFIAIPETAAGTNIYTGIEGVEAQEMDVKVVNGVVEVNGVYGMIKVIDATGAVAAEAVGTGDVTEIEGLGTGVYVVTAKDMKPTKILIK